MKIAVTYQNGQIFQHFGHTQQFKVYEVADNKVLSAAVVDTGSSGHGALAGVLNMLNVDVLICGGIGGGAQMALAQAGAITMTTITAKATPAATTAAAAIPAVITKTAKPTCFHRSVFCRSPLE